MDAEKLRRINSQVTDEKGNVKSISEQFSMWKRYAFDIANPMIVSKSSRELGLKHIEDLPLILNTGVIAKCLAGKKSRHFLSPSFFHRLDTDIENHIFSMESMSRSDSIVIVEDRKDYKGNPVIVALALGKEVRGEKAHVITSIYGRARFQKWIEASVSKGCRMHINDRKERLLNGIRLQLPRQIEVSLSNMYFIKNKEKNQEEGRKRMEKRTEFQAFVTNIKLYGEGILKGDWLSLPASKEDIEKLFETIEATDSPGQYFITDYLLGEYTFLERQFGEYADLHEVNAIAALLHEYKPEPEKLKSFIDIKVDADMALIGNAVVNHEQIPYQDYAFDGMEFLKRKGSSAEELYGYTIAEQSGLYEKIEALDMEDYMDFEAYGRDNAINNSIWLLKEGYLEKEAVESVDLNTYTMDQLLQMTGNAEVKLGERDMKEQIDMLVPKR